MITNGLVAVRFKVSIAEKGWHKKAILSISENHTHIQLDAANNAIVFIATNEEGRFASLVSSESTILQINDIKIDQNYSNCVNEVLNRNNNSCNHSTVTTGDRLLKLSDRLAYAHSYVDESTSINCNESMSTLQQGHYIIALEEGCGVQQNNIREGIFVQAFIMDKVQELEIPEAETVKIPRLEMTDQDFDDMERDLRQLINRRGSGHESDLHLSLSLLTTAAVLLVIILITKYLKSHTTKKEEEKWLPAYYGPSINT